MPVAKIVKGSTPNGCLNYVLGKAGAVLHHTNCLSQTPAGMTREFDLAVQAQAQRQTRGRKAETTVYHTSIAFELECRLTTSQKLEIAHRYLEGMGFDRTQNAYVVAEHHDTHHQHLHVITSRIRWDGYTTPCWQDYQRAEAIMRQVEAEYGLKPVVNSRDAQVKAPTVAEVRKSRTTGQPIPRVVIQQAIDDCIDSGRCHSLAQLQKQLQEQHGITLTTKPVTSSSGAATLALFFTYEHLTFSASKLGKKYRYGNLMAELLTGMPEQISPAVMDGDAKLKTGQLTTDEVDAMSPDQVLPQVSAVQPYDLTSIHAEAEAGGATPTEGSDNAEAEAGVSAPTEAPNHPVAKVRRVQQQDDQQEWQEWLDYRHYQIEQHLDLEPEVSGRVQQDWALWNAFARETEAWLRRKGLSPATDEQGQRRLAEVALYCRLKGYAPEQVARALAISPCKLSRRDPKINALSWNERDKERFALLKLMMQVDEQVRQLQRAIAKQSGTAKLSQTAQQSR